MTDSFWAEVCTPTEEEATAVVNEMPDDLVPSDGQPIARAVLALAASRIVAATLREAVAQCREAANDVIGASLQWEIESATWDDAANHFEAMAIEVEQKGKNQT